jgi:prepilin signal peptidase PulO-like enzyme (type II secretory pathway)
MILSILTLIVVGLVVGGFINALADDLPHDLRLKLPHYPDGTPRPKSAWIGIAAFMTGQRYSPSGSQLSWRHPITEVTTILGMLVAFAARQDNTGVSDVQLIFWLIYIAIFVLITIIDIEHRLILFVVIIPSAVIAILDALVTPDQRPPDLQKSLLGGVLGFGVFYIMYMGGKLYVYVAREWRERNISEVAFGYGDVMMATLSGLILGLEPMIFALFITVFLGASGALLYLIGRSLAGQKSSLFVALPYGPYIVLGTFIMMLFSSQVRQIIAGY